MLVLQQRLPRFIIAGLLSTAVHYLLLFTLFYGFNVEVVISSTMGAAAGAMANYLINYFYTFSSQRKHRRALRVFILVVSIGLLLNAGVVALAFHYLFLPVLISQILATTVTFLWNYQAHQRWTF